MLNNNNTFHKDYGSTGKVLLSLITMSTKRQNKCNVNFKGHLAGPKQDFVHFPGDSLNHLMLVTVTIVSTRGHQDIHTEVAPLSSTEPATFRFQVQYLNPVRLRKT